MHEPIDISVLRSQLSIALQRAARPTVKQAIQVKMISNGKWQRADNELFLYRFAITFELLPFDYSRVFKAEIGARQQRADGHVPIPRPAGAALRELRPR